MHCSSVSLPGSSAPLAASNPSREKSGTWTMNGVETAPESVESLIRGGQDFVLACAGLLFEPVAPSGSMQLVGFFVDSEIRQSFRLIDAVKSLEAIDFRRSDFRYLR